MISASHKAVEASLNPQRLSVIESAATYKPEESHLKSIDVKEPLMESRQSRADSRLATTKCEKASRRSVSCHDGHSPAPFSTNESELQCNEEFDSAHASIADFVDCFDAHENLSEFEEGDLDSAQEDGSPDVETADVDGVRDLLNEGFIHEHSYLAEGTTALQLGAI